MNGAIFQNKYEALNVKQKEAVDTIEGPVMVVAGPGTGKTTVLTLRIANILRQTDTPASAVLAITFTESGVASMRTKLREIIGSTADDVHIHTFHGFAATMISEYAEYFPETSGFAQLSDIEQERIIREIITDPKYQELRPAGRPDFYVRSIMSAISDAKREAQSPEDIKEYAEEEKKSIENDEANIASRGKNKGQLKEGARDRIKKCERTELLSDVYSAYENRKQELEVLDFDDLIYRFLSAIRSNESILRMIQERFLYILVDEHQDTNDAQNSIIYELANFFDSPNLFIVGDEKQAIFRFQGASVENFMNLRSIWPEMKLIQLDANYRSHQTLLDSSFRMIEGNYQKEELTDLRVRLTAKSDLRSRDIEVIEAPSESDMERHLIEQVNEIVNRESDASIGIIVKRNIDVERVLNICLNREIDVSAERSIDVFSHPVGLLFFELLEFLNDPTRVDSLAKTVVGGLWDLGFEESLKVSEEIKAGRLDTISSMIPKLSALRADLSEDGAVSFIFKLAHDSGLLKLASRRPESAEVWRGLAALAESLAQHEYIRDPRRLIEQLLTYRQSAKTRTVKITAGPKDSVVKVMTAHGSKGLEYDYVFIPYASDDAWFSKRSQYFTLPNRKSDTEENVKDARRLFYVALTRARNHASILFGAQEAGGRILTPLRFIDELEGEGIERLQIPASSGVEHPLIPVREGNQAKTHIITEYAKRVLNEKGLSVSALNNFLKCPRRFYFLNILRISEGPSAPSEKGNAVHKGISEVWLAKEDDEQKIKQIMEKSVDKYLEKSVLSGTDIVSVRDEVANILPDLSRALGDHISQRKQKNIGIEMWSGFEQEFLFHEENVALRLHGRLDAVIDDGKTAEVFDYKTRASMSENAIRGKTQNEDGGYFRQLVFYKLLLSHDRKFRDMQVLPALMFVKPNKQGVCGVVAPEIEDIDIETLKTEIQSLVDSIYSGDFISTSCEDGKCEWCSLMHSSLNI